MNIHQLISLSVLVSIYLLLSTGSNAFSSLPPPPVQPPPLVNAPPSLLQPGGTTALPNTPWALCQSLPQDCIPGGAAGGPNSAPSLGFGPQSCPIGSILITNQCVPVASPGMTSANTSPSISGASSNGCLPGELAENNLCIRAQSTGISPQLQQQQPQQQPQGLCPQGTILENNLCFPQQQVPTANFTSPGQQLATPHTNSNHNSTTMVSNLESFQRSGNGTNIEKNNIHCITANQSGSDCNTNSSVYPKH